MAQLLAGHFGHSVCMHKASTRVPTQITCQTFKQRPARCGAEGLARSGVPVERGRKYSHRPHSVNFRFFRDFPSRNREPVRPDEGAQYSPHRWVVNEVAGKIFSPVLQQRWNRGFPCVSNVFQHGAAPSPEAFRRRSVSATARPWWGRGRERQARPQARRPAFQCLSSAGIG
jgi:hypothetical protein